MLKNILYIYILPTGEGFLFSSMVTANVSLQTDWRVKRLLTMLTWILLHLLLILNQAEKKEMFFLLPKGRRHFFQYLIHVVINIKQGI